MEKRYQVFVSSTYEDLQEERREVMQALLALDCIPTGMELFPAADDDSWTLIKRFIEGCDYYIVVVGGRYGSTGPDGRGYTEMEYDFAAQAQIPTLGFLHGKPGLIPVVKSEPNDTGRAALQKFRKKIEDAKHAKYWTSAEQLAGRVALSMPLLMKSRPRVGWVRGDSVPDESAAQEMLKLKRKIEDLERQIDSAGMSAPPGTEMLAQGDEEFSIHFDYLDRSEFSQAVENFSWNDLVSLLGPILIAGAAEQEMNYKLVDVLRTDFETGPTGRPPTPR